MTRRGRGADHRVPVRAGPGHPHGDHGRHRPGRRRGILVKGGEVLEAPKKIDTVVFDKTGTLTARPDAAHRCHCRQAAQPDLVLRIAAAVESGSEHPIGAAIVAGARERGLRVPVATAFANFAGHGVRAEVEASPCSSGGASSIDEHDWFCLSTSPRAR